MTGDVIIKWIPSNMMGIHICQKNSRNETLSKQLQIWRNKQQVANCNGWLILDNQILLNPELESQKWVSDKDLNFIRSYSRRHLDNKKINVGNMVCEIYMGKV